MLLFFPNSQIVSFQNLTTVLLATRTSRLYLRRHVRLVILTARTFGAVNEYPSLYEIYKAILISFFFFAEIPSQFHCSFLTCQHI